MFLYVLSEIASTGIVFTTNVAFESTHVCFSVLIYIGFGETFLADITMCVNFVFCAMFFANMPAVVLVQ